MDLVPIKLTWPVQPGALATDSWWRVASQMKVGLPHRTCVAQIRQAVILCVAFLIIFFLVRRHMERASCVLNMERGTGQGK